MPASDTLLADDYGFHYGFVWYRGTFQGTGAEKALRLYARNSYSVWLNGTYLGSSTAHNDRKGVDDQLAIATSPPSNATVDCARTSRATRCKYCIDRVIPPFVVGAAPGP